LLKFEARKPPKPINYPCRLCGIRGHKLTNYLKFGKMQTRVKDKGGKTIKNKPIAKVKIANASINMVDVHVTTQSMAIEEQNYNGLGFIREFFKSSWWKPYNKCR
jgi:hypothetical protein